MPTFRPGPFPDSLQASAFGLEIEGDTKGVFKKCSGISTKHEIITEQKVKDGKTGARALWMARSRRGARTAPLFYTTTPTSE